jgi:hypothetical protein
MESAHQLNPSRTPAVRHLLYRTSLMRLAAAESHPCPSADGAIACMIAFIPGAPSNLDGRGKDADANEPGRKPAVFLPLPCDPFLRIIALARPTAFCVASVLANTALPKSISTRAVRTSTSGICSSSVTYSHPHGGCCRSGAPVASLHPQTIPWRGESRSRIRP